MHSRIVSAVILASLAAASVAAGRLAGAAADQAARLPTTSPSAPVFLQWPLPATAKAYGAIDGARLWQHVKDHGEIAERYRQQGHSQFWGIIAGTSGDADEAQWLLGQYKRIIPRAIRRPPSHRRASKPQRAPTRGSSTRSIGCRCPICSGRRSRAPRESTSRAVRRGSRTRPPPVPRTPSGRVRSRRPAAENRGARPG